MKITKLTNHELMAKVIDEHPLDAYRNEDVSLQTQLFWLELTDIEPSIREYFLSLCRPNVHIFFLSGVSLVLNAQDLIDIMRKGLCAKSPIYELMSQIRSRIFDIDYHLGKFFVPNCIYRNGFCIYKEGSCGQGADVRNSMFSYYKELING